MLLLLSIHICNMILIDLIFKCFILDTESAKAARRQLKETIYSVLFDMNVPAICAINQVDYLFLYFSEYPSGLYIRGVLRSNNLDIPIIYLVVRS